MNTRTLQEVADWMKSTDLTKISYRKGPDALELDSETVHPMPDSAFPACRLIPVSSQEVGLFRFNAVGSSRGAGKDDDVKEGQLLGHIEAGSKKHDVKAPVSGRIVSELIEDGNPVEYGQALFFIQP